MKALEIILAVLAVLFGLLSAAASYADRPRLAGITGAAAVIVCGIWLLLRSV